MPPSIRTIAKEAGVAPITVSRALREGDLRVAGETRQRILEIADRQGYRPSPEIARLMTGVRLARTPKYQSTIAVLVLSKTEKSPSEWMPYTRELYKGIERRADAMGYGLEIFNPRVQGMSPDRIARTLYARNVAGVLILPSRQRVVHLRFPWEHFSALAATYSLWSPHLHRVVPHQYQGMQITIHQLRHLGYRRIGLAIPSEMPRRNNYMAASFYFTHESLLTEGKNRMPPFMIPMLNREKELTLFRKWFDKYRPEALITVAGRCSEYLEKDMGLRVPEDIGIAYLACLDAPPGATGINEGAEHVGSVAVSQLVDMINRNERGVPETPIVHLVEGRWVPGNTVRDIRKSKQGGKP